MANYSVLKAAVQAVIKTNGNQEITGANMQSTLISIINSLGTGYQFMGVATPSTSPGTPDYNVAYIGGAGTYANFGTSVTVPVGSICVFKYNGSWTKEQIETSYGGVFDISAYHASGGTLATYADLAAALGNGGANVPSEIRKGGMCISFVQSSDNKYVQFRYMLNDAANTYLFLNVSNWKNVEDETDSNRHNIEVINGEDYTVEPRWNSGYISNTGRVTTSSSWQYSDPIFLPKGRTIKLTTGGSSVAYISETNEEGSVHYSYQLSHSDTGYYEKTNNSDKYVCVCGYIANNNIPVTVHISPDPTALSLPYLNNRISGIVNPSIIDIGGYAINDALHDTCASDCQITYDKTLGLVGVTYSAGRGVYGESWDKGVLSVFPISNPNMVKHIIYAEIGQTYTIVRPWDGGEESHSIESDSHLSICMNIIALGNGIFRIIYCLRSAWVYRDYNFNTDTLGTIYFIEVNYDGTSKKCSWDKFTSFLEGIGLSNDNSHKQVYLTSQIMPKDANDKVYVTFSGNNSYPILCSMNIDSDNMVITPFAAYPYYSGYEAAFIKNGNTISLIARNNNDTPKGYSLAKSADNGATWSVVENLETGDNNRPRIVSYGEKVIVAYGINDDNRLRYTVKLKVGNDVSSLEELTILSGQFGLSLFSLLIVRDTLYLAWSDGQPNMGQMYGPSGKDKNKDCVKFTLAKSLVATN